MPISREINCQPLFLAAFSLSQIDDFLSGRSPLTLALRVGDHMMFVQLQLEQSVAQSNASHVSRGTSSTGTWLDSQYVTQRILEANNAARVAVYFQIIVRNRSRSLKLVDQ